MLPILRVVLGVVFMAASIPKIQRPYEFLINVYQYRLVAGSIAKSVAVALPFVEFTLGVCLVGGVFLGGSLLLSSCLCTLFAAVQLSAVVRELPIACGCFAGAGTAELVSYTSVIRAAVLATAAGFGLYLVVVQGAGSRPATQHDESGFGKREAPTA
jgi:hypothetical protein